MEKIRNHIANGASIKWVGYHGQRTVWVHLFTLDGIVKEIVYLKEDYTQKDFQNIISSSAASPRSITGTIWNSDTRLELLRLASIIGLNPGSDARPGVGKQFNGKLGCTMAYDIEQDRSRLPLSSFPTPSESITCIATYCSCGDKMLFSFIHGVHFEYVRCKSSKDTVTQFIEYVKLHSPQWLVGYNNFRYDNTCLAFHANERYDSIFIKMRVGAGSSLSYAFYIDIEGVYNIDILAYLDKTRRGSYTNMSLATVVRHHDLEDKMDFDTSDLSNIELLFEYNLHDSMITMKLAQVSGSITEITSLAVVSCSPVIDCARFVSGTLAACSIASYCLDNHICMDWSPCTDVQEYRGAEVLKPVIGMHKNVISCDFSSMYPTVLVASNISVENQTVCNSTASVGAVWNTSHDTTFVIYNQNVSFDKSVNCIIPPVMKLFVDKRKHVRKTNPSYALGLKVAANSIYGSLGDRHSRIYSPNCSAAVTTGGRWCLSLAEAILSRMGYRVVYGDTDSCFVAPTTKTLTDIHTATYILSQIFMYTPFPGMSMEVERTYSKIAFLGKKTYFGRISDGPIISKGMSKSRKDRIGICRTFSSIVIPIVLSDLNARTISSTVGDMLSIVIDATVGNQLQLAHISKIVKRGGTNYYEYQSDQSRKEWKECESHTGVEKTGYSSGYIVKSLKNEINSMLSISGIGTFSSAIKSSSII